MKLIPTWRHAWRWWSVRVSALGAALAVLALAAPDVVSTVWSVLPDDVLARLPRNVALTVPLLIQLAAIVARVIQQREASDGR